MEKIQVWVAGAGLKFSPIKYGAVLFDKGKLVANFPGKLLVNIEKIEYSHEATGSSTSGLTST